MANKVTIYIATHCLPCQKLKEQLEKGHFLINGKEGQVDVIDIETKEGFAKIKEMSLTGIPRAYKNGKQCKIRIDEEDMTVFLDCEDEPRENKKS